MPSQRQPKLFPKADLLKVIYIYNSKIVERFDQYLKKSFKKENGLTIVVENSIFEMLGPCNKSLQMLQQGPQLVLGQIVLRICNPAHLPDTLNWTLFECM